MQPLNYDIRTYYRKHQTGENEDDVGNVVPVYATDGPYAIAFRPGAEIRTQTEQGYAVDQTQYLCIADGISCIEVGDVLTDGDADLYKVQSVKTYPTEQLFYVRAL